MSRTIEYENNLFGFNNLKNSPRLTINYFLKLNRRYFSHASKIAFLSSEIVEYCRHPS